jgi:hypothetical protein
VQRCKRLNGSLIKKFKIDSLVNISDREVQNLFKKDNTIRVCIPPNHSVNVIYKLKNGGYSITVELPEGVHDLKNNLKGDKEIEQIDARTTYTVSHVAASSGNKILVFNKEGDILFTSDTDSNINWDVIYTYYGLDDYYVVYPWGRRMYYYYNYPYYRKYRKYPRYRRPCSYRRRRVLVVKFFLFFRSFFRCFLRTLFSFLRTLLSSFF